MFLVSVRAKKGTSRNVSVNLSFLLDVAQLVGFRGVPIAKVDVKFLKMYSLFLSRSDLVTD